LTINIVLINIITINISTFKSYEEKSNKVNFIYRELLCAEKGVIISFMKKDLELRMELKFTLGMVRRVLPL